MTRTRTLFTLSLAALAPAAAAAQGTFEGIVEYRLASGSEKPMFSTSYVRGHRTRTEIKVEGQTSVTIMDNDAGKWYTLIPGQKMYMVTDIKALAERAEKMPQSKAASEKNAFRFAATGRKETIAGHTCEVYRISSTESGTDVDMCLAKGMGTFMGMYGGAGAGEGMAGARGKGRAADLSADMAKMAAAMKDGAFLLRMEAREGPKSTFSMVATRVEKKSVDAALFSVPAGYKEWNMEEAMREARAKQKP